MENLALMSLHLLRSTVKTTSKVVAVVVEKVVMEEKVAVVVTQEPRNVTSGSVRILRGSAVKMAVMVVMEEMVVQVE